MDFFSFIPNMIQSSTAIINTISHGNQMIAGALTLTLSTSILFLLRNAPKKLFEFIGSQFVVSINFNSGPGYSHEKSFIEISKWIDTNSIRNTVRTLIADSINATYTNKELAPVSEDADDVHLLVANPGSGTTFLVLYKFRLYWCRRTQTNLHNTVFHTYSINTISRKNSVFNDIINIINEKCSARKATYQSFTSYGSWSDGADVQTKLINPECLCGFDSLALNPDVLTEIKDSVDVFMNSKIEFKRVGIPYKSAYMLYGIPGTGKTSIIRAVAEEYNLHVCSINVNSVNDSHLLLAFKNVQPYSIILLEDIDCNTNFHCRDDDTSATSVNNSGVSLSALLNTLNGAIPLDSCLVFITTNHIEKLDPAIYRDGRVDHRIEVKEIQAEVLQSYFERLYPGLNAYNIPYKSIPACAISKIKKIALCSTEKCAQALIECFNSSTFVEEAVKTHETSLASSVSDSED